MWDLIVSVPDHCLSFYFAFCFRQEHYIKIWRKNLLIPIQIFIRKKKKKKANSLTLALVAHFV